MMESDMSELIHRYDLLAIGNLTLDLIHEVDRVPRLDETGLVVRKNICFGGRAGNIAVIGARLGLGVAIVSFVGDDFIRSGYKSYLLRHRVNVDKVKILKTEKCAKTLVFRQRDAKQVYFFQPNIQQHSYIMDLRKEELERFKVIYLTSFNSEKSVKELMKKLKHLDCIFFGFGEEIYRKSGDFLRTAIEISSYLDLNETEFKTLLKKMKISSIAEVFEIGTKLKFVCVSLGEKGSVIYTRNKKYEIAVVPTTKVVSTLGAGDAYVAGLIYGIINKWSVEKCGRLGSVLSSFIIEGEGAQSRLPDWRSLRKRYNQSFGQSL
jgi:sugar/nucleoside kinase (ribokinase family)